MVYSSFKAAVTTFSTHWSTVSTAFITAFQTPVCPTISAFAKFKQMKSGLLSPISFIAASVSSMALISGFKS